MQPPPVPCVPGPVYAAAPAPVAAHAAALLFTLATTMELLPPLTGPSGSGHSVCLHYFTTCARVIDFTN